VIYRDPITCDLPRTADRARLAGVVACVNPAWSAIVTDEVAARLTPQGARARGWLVSARPGGPGYAHVEMTGRDGLLFYSGPADIGLPPIARPGHRGTPACCSDPGAGPRPGTGSTRTRGRDPPGP